MEVNNFELNSIGYVKKGTKKTTYQDKMNAKTFDDGISIVALADGLGSKSKSDVGAEIAVETAIETLHEIFTNIDVENLDQVSAETVKASLLEKIREKITVKAKTSNMSELKEYACTLLFAVIKDNRIALGQIGDGYIVTRKNNGATKLVFDPKNENIEYTNGTETIFSNPRYMHLAAGRREDFDYIFLSSDGTDKLIDGEWKGHYTPFISGKDKGRLPQSKIFDYMSTLLNESRKGNITPNLYLNEMTNSLASMLIDNRVDDDVTFSFVNVNEKGPTRRIIDLLELIRREKIKSQTHEKSEKDKDEISF